MGCSASVEIFDKTVYPYPDNVDGDEKKPTSPVVIAKKDPLTLKGDALSKSNAKWTREQILREKHKKRFNEAKEMSDYIMDEKERLSLSTRSRATSRNTSRTGSPKHDHRGISSRVSLKVVTIENGKRYDTPPSVTLNNNATTMTTTPPTPPLGDVREVSDENRGSSSPALIVDAAITDDSSTNNKHSSDERISNKTIVLAADDDNFNAITSRQVAAPTSVVDDKLFPEIIHRQHHQTPVPVV
ncbi:uncharacterized protein LOC141912937 [Tubulanus polymorphus]|uniref:uncharacterized protein LOC141912937 n=1 Tax=Tubulanus polymorphus TaxID=672921 RepID=UPI003DA21484